jgi:hypothetical protein
MIPALCKRLILAAVLAAFSVLVTGCATTESENMSARPWNSPKGWETGLPATLNEGR